MGKNSPLSMAFTLQLCPISALLLGQPQGPTPDTGESQLVSDSQSVFSCRREGYIPSNYVTATSNSLEIYE